MTSGNKYFIRRSPKKVPFGEEFGVLREKFGLPVNEATGEYEDVVDYFNPEEFEDD